MVEAEKNEPESDGPLASASLDVTPEYLAGLVHELRNPLTPIRTATELLRSLSSDPRQLQVIDLISRQVVTLTHMLDDVLDAARGQRGLLALCVRTIDAAELIEPALAGVRAAIDERRQNLFVSLPSESVQMDCDPVRLGQAIQTLLHNANRYTPPGGSIGLKVLRQADELVIEVSDDGVGIAPQALPHIFNVFARTTVGGGEQGSGFSLAIARNLVELHRGSITVQSEGVGRGSTFTVRLPLDRPSTEIEPAQPGGSLKILIIDDHQDSVRGWVECMVRAGHSVLTAASGELGIALAAQFQPDAVIVDIGLPGIDGFEVGRALCTQAQTKNALLIAVSGYSLKQFRDFDAYTAFRHYLLKPVSPSALLYVIEQTIKHAGSSPRS